MYKDMRRAFRFFLENAGYCTPPGRAVCALNLARAERTAEARACEFVWEWDNHLAQDGCQDDFCSCQTGQHKEHEYLRCFLKDENGVVLASCGVVDPGQTYGRVMQAELASEALWEEARSWGSCAHAAAA